MKYVALCGMCAVVLLGGCGEPSPAKLRREALSEFQLGRIERARVLLRQVLDMEPGDADSLYLMGRIHYAKGAYETAMFYYQSCLDVNPGYPNARRDLADAERMAGPVAKDIRIIP